MRVGYAVVKSNILQPIFFDHKQHNILYGLYFYPLQHVYAFTNLIVGQFWVESAFLTNRLMSGKNLIGQPSCSASTQQLTNHC